MKKIWKPIFDADVPIPERKAVQDVKVWFVPDSDVYRAIKMMRRCAVCNDWYYGKNELCKKCIKRGLKSDFLTVTWNATIEDVERMKTRVERTIICPLCKNMMFLETYDRAIHYGFDNRCQRCRFHVNSRTGEIHPEVWY
jgi:uncharacterized CHY-type Zn-finger protein